jgi:two-component system KDP operon response regulator KdpE
MANDRSLDRQLGEKSPFRFGFRLPQRILVLEDDGDTARSMAHLLERAGYDVLTCGSAAEALDLMDQTGLPHLAVVDSTLPDMSGLVFCRRILQFSDLPMIVLIAAYEDEVVAEELQQCAEDYLTKPLNAHDLVTRVQRVMRRYGDSTVAIAHLVQVDDSLSVDFAHQHALVRGRQVPITALETKILYILMRHAGRVVTTDFLLSRLCQPDRAIVAHALRFHIERLREKIEPDPSRANYILDEHQEGYRFPVAS